MTRALNKYRYDHVVGELKFIEANAVYIQNHITDSKEYWNKADWQPTDITVPSGKYTAYYFYSTDTAALFASGAAADGWYAGKDRYDFTDLICKDPVGQNITLGDDSK